jgi:hypothetical protein
MTTYSSIRETLILGDDAIMVTHRDGVYEIPGAAESESWSDVVNNIDGEEESVRVDDLAGWGYKKAVHVKMTDGSEAVYFVR